MYNFLNLGFDGYQQIINKDLRNARMLARALENTYFTVSYLTGTQFRHGLFNAPSDPLRHPSQGAGRATGRGRGGSELLREGAAGCELPVSGLVLVSSRPRVTAARSSETETAYT